MRLFHFLLTGLVAFLVFVLAACQRVPSSATLAGEWVQDINYVQSKNIMNQLLAIDAYEDYELYFSPDHVAATRVVGREPDIKRVFWDSPLSFATDSAGNHQIIFNLDNGSPVTATVAFQGKHLLVTIGKRRLGFLRERATNLRVKDYVPK